ncbi:MAG: tetratricopeptide repeat protein [Spirochaetaceae bacterium]|jgi:tetratricopeptide (TPR) repeat protein|nr:tetratricopeptide repeat protein [Spirochaetaceae bacterium]
MKKKRALAAALAFLFASTPLWAQIAGNTAGAKLQAGISLFGERRFGDAIIELRRAQTESQNNAERAEAQFWIAMSQLSAAQYRNAIHDFDEITRLDPLSIRRLEIPYQKGRAHFSLKNYNEAIILFKEYADSIQIDGRYIQGVRADNWYAPPDNIDAYNRKAAAIFWIGESLYHLNQHDKALEMFDVIIRQYPKSVKFEAASNRAELIKQKKLEAGLLEIIRLNSGREGGGGLETGPDARRRESAYEDAVLAYKNSIAPFLIPTKSAPVITPQSPGGARPEIPRAPPVMETPGAPKGVVKENQNSDTMLRLLNIKTQALEMMDRMVSTLNAFEAMGWERW